MTHFRRPYPGIGHAVLMSLGMIALSNALSVPIVIVQMYGPMITEGATMPDFATARMPPALLGVVNILAIGGVIWWGYNANRVSWRTLLPFTRVPLASLVAVVIASLGFSAVLSEVDNLLRLVLPVPDWFVRLMSETLSVRDHPWATAILLTVVAPLTEEPLFRGVILRGLLGHYRALVAIIVSAVLFGFVHLNPWQFVSATMLGLAYGWWFTRTRSLWPGILGHAINNGIVFALHFIPLPIPGFAMEQSFDVVVHQPWWFTLGGVVLLAGGCWWFARVTRSFVPPPIPLPELPPPLPAPANSAM